MANYATLVATGPERPLGSIEPNAFDYQGYLQSSTVLSNGDLYVLRFDFQFGAPGDDYRLLGQTFNALGQPTSPLITVWSAETAKLPRPFDTAALTDGRYVVAFNVDAQNTSDLVVRAVTYDPGGSIFFSRDMVGEHGIIPMPTAVSALGQGFVATWAPTPSDFVGHIYGGSFLSGFGASGTTILRDYSGPVFVTGVGEGGDWLFSTNGMVNYYDFDTNSVSNFPNAIGYQIQAGASLVGRGETAALAWVQASPDGASWTLYSQLFDLSKGGFVGSPTVIDTRDYLITSPSVAATADGGYVVSWNPWGDQGYRDAKAVGPQGEVSAEFLVNGDVIGMRGTSELITVRQDNVNHQLSLQVYAVTPADTGQPPPSGGGQTITAHSPNSTLVGTSGDDTITTSQGGDTVSGGAGADRIVLPVEPWSPHDVTDFALGQDRLDLSALFDAAGYTGSDPVADRYVWLLDDGAGGTKLLFDSDGAGPDPQWPNYVVHLEHVPASGLTWAQLSSGGGQPPPSGGMVLTSDQYGDTLVGGPGNDTLNAGRGPDTLTGGDGADQFGWAELPWNAGHVTDFADGDKLDLRALFRASGYAGSDPVADGRLSFVASGSATQVYFDPDAPGAGDWPWLITTLDGVQPGQIGPEDWLFR